MCYMLRRVVHNGRVHCRLRLAGDPATAEVEVISFSVCDEQVDVEYEFDRRRDLTMMPEVGVGIPMLRPGGIVTMNAAIPREDVVPIGFSGSPRPLRVMQ